MSSSTLIINPYIDIDKAIQNKDWFSGFANAVSYFEHFGTKRIRQYLDTDVLSTVTDEVKRSKLKNQLEEDLGKSLERLSVQNIVFWLYMFRIIDVDTFLGIKEIIAERNKLVHPARKGIAWRYAKPERTAKELLEKSKDYIRVIIS